MHLMRMLYASIFSKGDKFMSAETIVRKFKSTYPISTRSFRRYLIRVRDYMKAVHEQRITIEDCTLPYFKPISKEDIQSIVDEVYDMEDPNPPAKKYRGIRIFN